MLNLVNLLKKKQIIKTNNEMGQSIRTNKRNIPASKEWINSVYSFNKNTIRFLPAVHDYVFKLLKGYFNLVNIKLRKKLTSKKARKIHYLSNAKVWISAPEIKHLSDKLYITIYVYNRIYNIYKKKLQLLEFDWGPNINLSEKKIIVKPKKKVVITTVINANNKPKDLIVPHKNIPRRFSLPMGDTTEFKPFEMKDKLPGSRLNYSTVSKTSFPLSKNLSNFEISDPKLHKTVISPDKKIKFNVTRKTIALRLLYPTYTGKTINTRRNYIEMIKWLKLDKIAIVNQYKSNFLTLLGNKQQWISQLENLKVGRHNYLINQFTKELAYLKMKQMMLFNQFKFSEIYLTPMINFLQNIYKKKVIINVIALKYYYLNTNILSQIIVNKLKKERYRGRSLTVVDESTSRIRIPALGSNKFPRVEKKFLGMQNVILDNYNIEDEKKDYLEQFLLTKNITSDQYIHKSVLENLENKAIAGIFMKISGRLTKRYRADRALSKLRNKGTLKNVYSAHKGFSSNLSRGYSNINVEKTIIQSKTRVGAYGLTGWIASY